MDGPTLLRQWRKDQGLTQAQAGELFHVSAASVCDWEKRKKTPVFPNIHRIAEVTKGFVPDVAWLNAPAPANDNAEHEPKAGAA